MPNGFFVLFKRAKAETKNNRKTLTLFFSFDRCLENSTECFFLGEGRSQNGKLNMGGLKLDIYPYKNSDIVKREVECAMKYPSKVGTKSKKKRRAVMT